MIEHEIEISTPDGTCDGVLFRIEKALSTPGVIHLTDIGGIRPASREMARRLAGEGYVVLMPNVFYRTTRPPVFDFPVRPGEERFMKRFAELTGPLTPEAIELDASAYVDFLAGQGFVSMRGMGVVGHCYTGGVGMRMAAARPDRIVAAASFHGGGLFTDKPASPHLVLPRIKAQLYFAHAIEDRSMPEEAIAKLNRELKKWGGIYESEVYDGAYHSWTSPDSPVYNHDQADRAFSKLKELFARTLK